MNNTLNKMAVPSFAKSSIMPQLASARLQKRTRQLKRSTIASPWLQRESSSPSKRYGKSRPRRTNSYVAPGPRDTMQVDLADFRGFGPSTEFRYALIGTDVFTKLAFARPLKGKTPEEVAVAMEEALKTYGIMKMPTSTWAASLQTPSRRHCEAI